MLWLLIIVTIAQGALFIFVTPQWEGFDEAFHYAYIQYIAEHGKLPIYGKDLISRELTQSFRLLPLSVPANSNLGNRYTSFPDYWKLSDSTRQEREKALKSIDPRLRSIPDESQEACLNYEAQHPPLYYLLCAVIYKLFCRCSLSALSLILRAFSFFIGSLSIVAAWKLTKQINFPKSRLHLPLLIALLPMFYSAVARISNDCLGAALFSFLVLFTTMHVKSGGAGKYAFYVGITTGLGLLTKAYFLTAIPAIAVIFAIQGLKTGARRKITINFGLALGPAVAISGWWLIRNYSLYGTFSGLFVLASAAHPSFIAYLQGLLTVPWTSGITTIIRQQIWTGNSSFIGLSKAIYLSGYIIAIIAALGLARAFRLKSAISRLDNPKVEFAGIMISFYLFFVLGMLYQLFSSYMIAGQIITGGWYLYAIVIPWTVLILYGLETLFPFLKNRISSALICYALLINFLGNFCKAIPYYSGHILPRFHMRHLLELYSPSGFQSILQGLAINKPAFITPHVIGFVIAMNAVLLVVVLAQSIKDIARRK
jgi:hypothetical protein